MVSMNVGLGNCHQKKSRLVTGATEWAFGFVSAYKWQCVLLCINESGSEDGSTSAEKSLSVDEDVRGEVAVIVGVFVCIFYHMKHMTLDS